MKPLDILKKISFINDVNTNLFLKILLFYFFCILILPNSSFYSDASCWINWSRYIKQYGFTYTYNSGTNYNPFYQYILGFYSYLNPKLQDINNNIKYLKLITLIFDLLPLLFINTFLSRLDNKKDIFPYLLLFNPIYLYNTLVWGQVDAIYTTFVFFSYYFFTKKNPVIAFCMLVLAINMKTQALIFFPPLFIIYLIRYEIKKHEIITIIFSIILLQTILIFPFLNTIGLFRIWKTLTGSIDFYPVISMNAYNFWALILNKEFLNTSDKQLFWGFSFKFWGLMLFFISSTFCLLALLHQLFLKYIKNIKTNFEIELELLALGSIPVFFFFFNTQMHERYSHPCLLFLAIYAFKTKNWSIFILSNLAYFLNLEGVLGYFGLNYAIWVFNPKLTAILFSVLIVIIMIELYKNIRKRTKNSF